MTTAEITATAIAEVVRSLDIQPGEVERLILHWSGGGAYPGEADHRAYHLSIDQSLGLHRGKFTPDDNVNTADRIYAAHTLHSNTKAFGLDLCGMGGAKESPLDFGPTPINEAQFKVSALVAAYVLRAAALPVAPHTALSHAEVEKTLGIRQKGKWDISVLPWRSDIRGARAVGDYWRSLVKEAMEKLGGEVITVPAGFLREGNTTPSEEVRMLQRDLADIHYFAGKIDGYFGRRTKAAVIAFQSDNGLKPDGIVGPITREALRNAEPRPLRDVTEKDLRESGSGTVLGGDAVVTGSAGLGGISAVDIVAKVDEAVAVVERAAGPWEKLTGVLGEVWLPLACLGFAIWFYKWGRFVNFRRLMDAMTGANDRL